MADLKDTLLSKPFVFVVGRDHIEVTVHKNIAKGKSEPLHALMNNDQMVESREGRATLEDTEFDTFYHFCQWAYGDDYTVESFPRQPNSTAEAQPTSVIEGEYKVPRPGSGLKSTCCVACYQPDFVGSYRCSRCGLKSGFFPANTTSIVLWAVFEIQKPPEIWIGSGTNNPLPHAKLYVFADKYLIIPLKNLCKRKIYNDLHDCCLTDDVVSRLVETMQYVQANTPSNDDRDAVNELRDMLNSYAAAKAKTLVRYPHFVEMLKNDGEIGAQIFLKISSVL